MKKYRDENGNEIIVFEKNEKRENLPKIPLPRFPFWSTYIPVVPCVYDANLTILEQISKLYYYANKLRAGIEQNHDDIVALGERVDGVEISLENILALIGDLPKHVIVEFDTLNDPITADKSFDDVLAEYRAGSLIFGHANGDNSVYIATDASAGVVMFNSPKPSGSVILEMRPTGIIQAIRSFITGDGGTVTGVLNISQAPVNPENAANKLYVDEKAAAEAATAAGDAVIIANSNAIGMVNGLRAEIEAAYLQLAGGVMRGQIVQPLTPTEARHLANKKYVDDSIANIDLSGYLSLTGGVMSGQIVQPLTPTEARHLSNKKYVDDSIANIDLSGYLSLTGGSMEGQILQPLMPTESRHLVNRQYVDNSIAAVNRVEVGTETKIGEWVENDITYDIYRKVIDFGELPNAGSKSVAHGVADIVRFTRVCGIATDAAGQNLPLPMVSANGANNIYLAVGNARVTIQTASDRSNFTWCYITLEYLRSRAGD